ncbi:fasciclin domain-containing protein [Nostoc parmelioides]|uniref:Fasciclin domain-containing protein n=1 Tax=Nostoc parmelioides FACHB-3921 TaxID=2692909 RepID=A0ABR8B7N9_9NOSO|nr:fasciclin domain-containing protein [Nostoc parmelioides]MBD2250137.1 fasciclin domain-containing protein [Nostoc parmelioides FACHB-3921]
MPATNSLLGKTFFKIFGAISLTALSACAQPTTETPTATVPPDASTPVSTVPPLTPTPSPTTPNNTTEDRNLGELANSAANQGQFTTLIQAVKAAGLTDQLAAPGPYTVFAPTDAAFAALPKNTLNNLLQPANKQQLVKLLAYHVLPGTFTSNQLKSGQVKTVEGSPVTINVDPTNNTVTVNGARVTQADIPASNGIVHVVDKVILPPNVPNNANTTPTPQ